MEENRTLQRVVGIACAAHVTESSPKSDTHLLVRSCHRILSFEVEVSLKI